MNLEALKTFLKNNNGYVTTKEIEHLGISKTKIPQLIKDKVLRKVSYGIYIDNDYFEDEYFLLQKRFTNTIFSYNTAFHLLNLSERPPYELDVTRISGSSNIKNINCHYVKKSKINIGVIEIMSPYGNPIKVYNAERCICDMLKNPNEYDIELYNKILNNYFKSNEKDLIKLDEYAKIFNVYEKLTTIIEVLIK